MKQVNINKSFKKNSHKTTTYMKTFFKQSNWESLQIYLIECILGKHKHLNQAFPKLGDFSKLGAIISKAAKERGNF